MNFFFEKFNNKALFSQWLHVFLQNFVCMSSRKKSRYINVFYVSQQGKNGNILGNEESTDDYNF